MITNRFTWGNVVRVSDRDSRPEWRPGSVGSVCGFRTIETFDQANAAKVSIGTIVYTVEFDDGESAQIPEDALDIVN